MMNTSKRMKEITLGNLKKGEVTLIELDEIYKEMGFLFIVNQGKLTKIKKETIH
ncbi:hypothetical protein [Asaccharospora irregularis]|uniref:Uncharacterized protein n=1 Tax=Asaccharospora irregularis DSM 2635 TaxID=1121321 RepID=A0A1M5Q2V8_9FIRM|nr:hypothetical protein [Asaccharospora irregularis]SHH08322.1 hypothetical protein SAMN04488530_1188 [Asaccharospora irregularis DSM 2635]